MISWLPCPPSFRKDHQLPPFFQPHFEKCRHHNHTRMKTMTPSSCRRLQNQFTINTWTENQPSSTLLLEITKIDLDSVHVRCFFRLPFFRNLDSKGLCCVFRRRHGIRRRPLRQVLGSCLQKVPYPNTMSGNSALSKRMTDLLHGVALALRPQIIATHFYGPRRPDIETSQQVANDFLLPGFQKYLIIH